jgi:hypothetical protein
MTEKAFLIYYHGENEGVGASIEIMNIMGNISLYLTGSELRMNLTQAVALRRMLDKAIHEELETINTIIPNN